MLNIRKLGGILAGLLTPGLAAAADMQFVVHNGFDETVQALQRLALITGDSTYVLIAGCLVAASAVFGTMFFATEGMAKRANNPTGFLIQGAAGLALFFGAVVPKGTLYVYDDVLNKTQAVGGIPDIIVFFAGSMNAIERELVRIVDTAAATPYSADIGTVTFQLIYSLSTVSQPDADLDRSIGQFTLDCGLTAIGTGQNGATMSELLRTSPDLRDTLAKYAHPAWPTTYFPTNNSGGVPGTCDDAWDYIRTRLDETGSSSPSALMGAQACSESGFNMADPQAAARCDAFYLEAAKLFGVAPASSPVFLKNFVINKGIMNMMMSPEFAATQRVLVNRQMMAQSAGTTEALNQWVPRLRSMLTAIVLAIIPIPLLFIATHLVYRSVGVVIGLMVFLCLWGVTDAVSVQMARDAAATAFATIRQQHMGFEAMMMAPGASLQALALYGKYRMMAMGMATLLATALFKVSTGAFGNSAEAAGNDISAKGADAGTRTMTSEGVGSTMGSLQSSTGAMAQTSTFGGSTTLGASAQPALQSGHAYSSYLESVSRNTDRTPEMAGVGFDNMMQAGGAITAGKQTGAAMGAMRDASESGSTVLGRQTASASAGTRMETGESIGRMGGVDRVAGLQGSSSADVLEGTANTGKAYDMSQTQARADASREYFGGPNGDIAGAGVAGAMAAANNKSDAEIGGAMQGGGSNEQLLNVSRLGKASTMGQAQAVGGSVDKATNRYMAEHQVATGEAEAMQKYGDPTNIGSMSGVNRAAVAGGTEAALKGAGFDGMTKGQALSASTQAYSGVTASKIGGVDSVAKATADGQVKGNLVGAKATSDVWNTLGPAPMIRGAIATKASEAYRGQAMHDLGGVYPTAQEVASNQVANDVASARISGQVGKMLGLNPDHIRDRLDVAQRQKGVVSMTLGDQDKAAFAQAAVKSGAMTQLQANELMAQKGQGRVDFTIDKNGNIGAPQVSTSSAVNSGNTVSRVSGTTDKVGDTFRRGDERSSGDSLRVNSPLMLGGTKVQDMESAARVYADLGGPAISKGILTDDMRETIAQAYSQRAEASGRSLRGDAQQSSTNSFTAGGSLTVGAGNAPAPGKAARGVAGGVSGSLQGQHLETWQSSNSASTNAFTTGMRSEIDTNWQKANAATERIYGDRSTWDSKQTAEANSYMLNQFAAGNENSFQRLMTVSTDRTVGEEASAQGHNTMADKADAAANWVMYPVNRVKNWFE